MQGVWNMMKKKILWAIFIIVTTGLVGYNSKNMVVKLITGSFFILSGIGVLIYSAILQWKDDKDESFWVKVLDVIIELFPDAASGSDIGYILILFGIVIIIASRH